MTPTLSLDVDGRMRGPEDGGWAGARVAWKWCILPSKWTGRGSGESEKLLESAAMALESVVGEYIGFGTVPGINGSRESKSLPAWQRFGKWECGTRFVESHLTVLTNFFSSFLSGHLPYPVEIIKAEMDYVLSCAKVPAIHWDVFSPFPAAFSLHYPPLPIQVTPSGPDGSSRSESLNGAALANSEGLNHVQFHQYLNNATPAAGWEVPPLLLAGSAILCVPSISPGYTYPGETGMEEMKGEMGQREKTVGMAGSWWGMVGMTVVGGGNWREHGGRGGGTVGMVAGGVVVGAGVTVGMHIHGGEPRLLGPEAEDYGAEDEESAEEGEDEGWETVWVVPLWVEVWTTVREEESVRCTLAQSTFTPGSLDMIHGQESEDFALPHNSHRTPARLPLEVQWTSWTFAGLFVHLAGVQSNWSPAGPVDCPARLREQVEQASYINEIFGKF
ncbi:hypothetical protein DFP72DRAFT_858140 [Ephemerocybe angulata]|uniref:Uncharacterized protein n=1 Tax=Ephemerocybe angulata TaxID=980116 RepID=A0A8H6HCN2_9AGAR|nr:hypothetical protein DFP72DRAFT_858140 [Tulosesus angulatus]